MTAGDTLVLKDGTYYPTGEWLIKGMHGTARAPIIIEAASDGGATIDGSNAGATHLLYVTNSSYLVFCGFNLRNSQRTNLMIAGAGNGTGDVSNITVERVISHNAGSGNQYCFIAQGNTSTADANILFQDDAALGRCRYGFIAYHINGVTFRRDWSSNAYTENFSPAPRSAFGVYAAANVTLENNIGVNEIPATTDNNYYTGVWQTSDDTANWPNNNTVYRGNMFFNGCTGVWLTDTSGTGTVLQDTYIDIPANPVCQANQGSFYRPLGVSWGDPFGGTMTNMAIVNSQTGVSGGTKVITNSVFANNGSALSGSVSGSYNDFYGNGSNGTTLGSTDSTANPNYNTATYGRGAYLMPAPALLGKGSGGADVGAHIIYQYDHGSLTSVPLWPWPMEGRILAATGKSVTYSSAGGIWKTLIGVY